MRYFFFILFVTLSSSLCAQVADSLLVATMERTTCYGKCPYYKIWIYSNGVLVYHGKNHVDKLGLFQTQVSPRKVYQILEKAYQIDFFGLNEKYPEQGLGILDFPTCITYLKINGQEKTIYNRNNSPVSLVNLEELIDRVADEARWQKAMITPSEIYPQKK